MCVLRLVRSNTYRMGSEEKRSQDRLDERMLNEVREAAEVHRQVRAYAQRFIKPGLTMIEIAQCVHSAWLGRVCAGPSAVACAGTSRRRRLPWSAPVGLSEAGASPPASRSTTSLRTTRRTTATRCADALRARRRCARTVAAQTVLGEKDVMKVDFGVQINGHIIDCAWTVAFDPVFDPLLDAVRDATNAGVKAAGIDVRLCDIGAEIQEVMEQGELELEGKTYQGACGLRVGPAVALHTLVRCAVKPIANLNGHSIGVYQIHAGKSVPIVKGGDATKMEEGEFYAIETFGSTGKGWVNEDLACSHYMKVFDANGKNLRSVPRAAPGGRRAHRCVFQDAQGAGAAAPHRDAPRHPRLLPPLAGGSVCFPVCVSVCVGRSVGRSVCDCVCTTIAVVRCPNGKS